MAAASFRPSPPSTARSSGSALRTPRAAASNSSTSRAAAAPAAAAGGTVISREECDALFRAIDRNNDSQLTRKEVKKSLSEIQESAKDHGMNKKLVKSAKAIFKSADEDNSKKLDADEFYVFMRDATHTVKRKTKELDRAMSGNSPWASDNGGSFPEDNGGSFPEDNSGPFAGYGSARSNSAASDKLPRLKTPREGKKKGGKKKKR